MNERQERQQENPEPAAEQVLLLTQFAADHAPDAIFWIDENARFVYVNEQACRSLEYTREELLAMTVPGIDPTRSIERWGHTFREQKKSGVSRFETVHKTKTGRL